MPDRNLDRQFVTGVRAALTSALFFGFTPIFGKLAILSGFPPLAVVAWRTVLAVGLLWIIVLVLRRSYLYIYPAGLMGCTLAGGVNGLGSLLYYSALGRIDAGLGQLLYSLYPLFVALWLSLDHQPLNRLTRIRLGLSLPAIYLLTQTGRQHIDLIGVGMMLGASALYALHLPINQRVLYDMPAPTVTLYTLFAMSLVVTPAYLLSGVALTVQGLLPAVPLQAWLALAGLTLVTFCSRLALFLGVKHLGGMQTALLGLSELLVTIAIAHFWLAERFSLQQWSGAILLAGTLGLVVLEKLPFRNDHARGWLAWINPF